MQAFWECERHIVLSEQFFFSFFCIISPRGDFFPATQGEKTAGEGNSLLNASSPKSLMSSTFSQLLQQ